ncbi:MAG: iron-containing alcohol dehydrogenase [Lachnospiraceae bacterium]|nr:iron-containing alcohol dehydrogenase [Lachnospiraceae bacterium]MCI9624604.1 iron-containing alcohol dehydrogenase [Lachnospiraceae bacterium]
MQNFMYHIPTKVHFGRGEIGKLAEEIKAWGTRVLLVYGGGSIKRIGLYDRVVGILNENDIPFMELGGVDPNPRVTSVEEGVKLCREHKLDVLLPVGGGSVIDCAKLIAAGTLSGSDDMWGIVTGKAAIGKVLPVITVLTLAATGSEMDTSAIITNLETQEKTGPSNPGMRPKVSIMDPEYTFTVSRKQTAAGTADIMSHALEVYFNNNKGAFLQSRFAEAVLKTCVAYGRRACENPEDYEARANLMWAGSWAINGLLTKGSPVGWSVHAMEHELSAYYDIVHGVGLAVLIPHWLRHMLREDNVWKYVEYGVNVWGIDESLPDMEIAERAIEATGKYFRDMGLPETLRDVGVDDSRFEVMAKRAGAGLGKAFVVMGEGDVLEIYLRAF